MGIKEWIKGVTDEGDDAYNDVGESPLSDDGEDTIANISKHINLNQTQGSGSIPLDSLNIGGGVLPYSLHQPTDYDDEIMDIADKLKNNTIIALNLERVSGEPARRIFDFLSGVSYAKGGCVQQLANKVFLISPYQLSFLTEVHFSAPEIF